MMYFHKFLPLQSSDIGLQGEIAFRKCLYFPDKIDDLHSKSAQNGKFSHPLT